MSKVVKTVVLVAAAAAIVVAAPYIGAFLAPALAGISAGLTAAAITSAIVGVGISLGVAGVMGLFRKVPNLSQALADRLSTQVRPTAPRKIIFGLTAAGSDVRFEQTHDLPSTKKDGFSQVVALASHRINAVKSVTLDDEVTWTGFLSGKYAPGITMFRAVTEGRASTAQAIANTLWRNTATFTGCAYYSATFKLDPDVFPQGVPSRRTVVVEGCPLYDPRLDSTRGGSGPHRVSDQSTWAYRNGSVEIGRNPALALLTYLLGYRINGKLAWGMGIPVEQINFANFIVYANVCEERVRTAHGGTIQRYECNAAFSTQDTHETVINAITATMGSCKLVDAGGLYGLIGGYDDTAGPKVALTADDILIGGYTWVPSPPQRERPNIARGQYCSAADQYQLADWGEVRTDPLPDGVDRPLVIDLGGVTRAETAQRIAKQFLLREAKTPGIFSATFGPAAFASDIGSLVTISGVENWQNKLFRVLDQSQSHELVFEMTLREESAEVYAWDREEKPLPASIRPPGFNPADVITPTNLSLASTSLQGANAVHMSVVNVSWTPELSGRVAAIELQSRATGSTIWSPAGNGDPKAGAYQFSSTVPGAQVDVRARYRMLTGVVSPWVTASILTDAVSTDWQQGISGPNKPQDNATNSADPSSPFGPNGGTVADAIGSIAKIGAAEIAIAEAKGRIDQVEADAAELLAAFGDTEAAAASADAAAAAKAVAELARDAAKSSSDKASADAGRAQGFAKQADDAKAAAATYSQLAASVGPGTLTQNPSFTNWADTQELPNGWTVWEKGGTFSRVAGRNGNPYALQMVCPADANMGVYQEVESPFGSYVIEATISADNVCGAGIFLQFVNRDGTAHEAVTRRHMTLLNQQDTSGWPGVSDGSAGDYLRTFSWFMNTPVNGNIVRSIVYVMANWDQFPMNPFDYTKGQAPRKAKTITFHSVRMRPATASEIALQNENTGLGSKASITKAEQVAADAAGNALTTARNEYSSQFAGITPSGLSNLIGQRPTYTEVSATVTDSINTAAGPSGAIGQRLSAVEVGSGGNEITNDAFLDYAGWAFNARGTGVTLALNAPDANWHPENINAVTLHEIGGDPNNYALFHTELIPVTVGQWYQASMRVNSHRCNVEMYVQHYDTAGNQMGGPAITGQQFIGNMNGRSLDNYRQFAINAQAIGPYMRVLFMKWGTLPGQGDSWAWMLQPQLMRVSGPGVPAQPFRPGSNRASSRITQTAIQDLQGRTASSISLSAVAGTSMGEINILANGGPNPYSQIYFKADKFLFDGGAIYARTVRASSFVTDQGVDLAAFVPGSIGYRLASGTGDQYAGHDFVSPVLGATGLYNTTSYHGFRVRGSVSILASGFDPWSGTSSGGIAVLYSLNGGPWTGLGAGFAGAGSQDYIQYSFDTDVDSPGNGTIQFGFQLYGNIIGSSAGVFGARNGSFRLEAKAYK